MRQDNGFFKGIWIFEVIHAESFEVYAEEINDTRKSFL